VRDYGKAEGERVASRDTAVLLALAPQKGGREAERLDLASPVLLDSPLAACNQLFLHPVSGLDNPRG
jgi:hypothetical protein